MLFAFSAHFKYKIKQINVLDAYLKEKLKEIIYMKISEKYQFSNDQQANQSNIKKHNRVLHLFCLFYDLKQFDRE